jgi:hypothetical protein
LLFSSVYSRLSFCTPAQSRRTLYQYLAASAALAFSAFIVAHRAPQCNPKNAPISSMGWREFPFFIFFATKERKKLGFPLFFAFFDFLAIFLQFFYERG